MNNYNQYIYVNGSSISAGGGFENYEYRRDVRDLYNLKNIIIPKYQFECTYGYSILNHLNHNNKLSRKLINEAKSGSGVRRLIRTSYDWINNNLDKLHKTIFIFEIQSGIRMDIFLKDSNEYIIGNGIITENGDVPLHLVREWYVQDNDSMRELNDRYSKKFEEFQKNFWSIDEEHKNEIRELELFISFCNELHLNYYISLNHPYNIKDSILSKIPSNRLINNILGGFDIWSYCRENNLLILNEIENDDNHLGVNGVKIISEKIYNHIMNDYNTIKILSIDTNTQDNNLYPLKFSFLNYNFTKKNENSFYENDYDALILDNIPFRGVKNDFEKWIVPYNKFIGKVKKILIYLSNEAYMPDEKEFIDTQIPKYFKINSSNLFVFDTTLWNNKNYSYNKPGLSLILKNYEEPLSEFNPNWNPFGSNRDKKLSFFVNKINVYRFIGIDKLLYTYSNKNSLDLDCYYSMASPNWPSDNQDYDHIYHTKISNNVLYKIKSNEDFLSQIIPTNLEKLPSDEYSNFIKSHLNNKFHKLKYLYSKSLFSLVFETQSSIKFNELEDSYQPEFWQISEKTIIPILCGNLPFIILDYNFYNVMEQNGFDFSYLTDIFDIDYKNNSFKQNINDIDKFLHKIKNSNLDDLKSKSIIYSHKNFYLMYKLIFVENNFSFLNNLKKNG